MRRLFGRGRTPFTRPAPGTADDPLLPDSLAREAAERIRMALVISGRLPAHSAHRVQARVLAEVASEGVSLGELTRLASREIWREEHGSYEGWEENLHEGAAIAAAFRVEEARVLYEQGEALKKAGQ